MPYDPQRHHRRSIRLRGYDYSNAGVYFVTLCVRDRICLFGEVLDGAMRLNDMGRKVEGLWKELPSRFPRVAIDEFVVMPNHFHGIIVLENDNRDPAHVENSVGAQFIAPKQLTLGTLVRTFKASSTRAIRIGFSPEFAWQRNYYERILRDDASLNATRNNVQNNSLCWESDSENPSAITTQLDSNLGSEHR